MVMGEKGGVEGGNDDENEREKREREIFLGERIVLNEGTRVGYVE